MPTYRGVDGFASLGGAVDGTPLTKGSVSQGASSATLDGGGSALNGVLRAGDTFTVAGDAQEYTLTADVVIGAVTPNEVGINFSPTVQPVGGWDDNAAVSFVSNSIAEVIGWEADVSREDLETTAYDEASPPQAKTFTLDIPEWRGTIRVQLDYDDPEQKEVIDLLVAGSVPTALSCLLAMDGGRQFWGNIHPSSGRIASRRGAIVEADLKFAGTGALTPNWKSS